MPDRVATTVLTAFGSLLGHHGGDYLVQDDCMARSKRQHTPQGRRELARHAATYTATQAATKALFYRTAGVRVPFLAQLAGAVTEGVLHAVIDDGRLLRRWAAVGHGRDRHADATGNRVGRQETFHNLKADGVNGRMLMDQAVHHQVQIPAGTVVTVAAAALLGCRAR